MDRKLRLFLSVLLAAAALLVAWRMYTLDQQRLLWGHLPLFFFALAWVAIVLAVSRRNFRWLGLSTLSGVLLAVGFPPLPLTFVLFIAWIPLLMVESEIAATGGPRAGRQVFRYAYHAFIVWNILTTYWVGNAAFVAGLFAISVNALLMTIPFMLFHWGKKFMPRLSYLLLVAYWITFEYLHLRWELSWPWLTLGNAFAEFPSWVQWYEYTGVLGGSLWILATNILLWKRKFAQAGAVLAIPLIASLAMYHTCEEQGGEPVEAVVVQPNYEAHYEKFDVPQSEQLERFLSLADSMVTPETRYVFFPETSFGPVRDTEIGIENTTGALEDWVNHYPDLALVTGLTMYHVFRTGETHSPNVREYGREGQVMYYESFNGATQFARGTAEYPIYKKSRLVPGAESFPYNRFLFFLKPIVDKLGGSTAGLATQKQRISFEGPQGLRVAPIICYESVFGEYHAGYIRAGAQFGAIITNDGWWDNTPGHRQHLRYASLRAIETRRDIARSANTGISAFINQRGDILQPTRYGEAAVIRGTLRPNDRITFYVRWGDLAGRIAMFLTVIFFLNNLVKKIIGKE